MQGLGKTVSTIALIVSNRPQPKQQGQPSAARLGAGGSSASLGQQQQQQQARQARKRQRPAASGAAGGGEVDSSSGESDDDEESGSSSDEFPTSSNDGSPSPGVAAAVNGRSSGPNGGAAGATPGAAQGGAGASSDSMVYLDGASEPEEGDSGGGRLHVSLGVRAGGQVALRLCCWALAARGCLPAVVPAVDSLLAFLLAAGLLASVRNHLPACLLRHHSPSPPTHTHPPTHPQGGTLVVCPTTVLHQVRPACLPCEGSAKGGHADERSILL